MSWSVGDLARRTGLTVRTLHHYDQLGLLRPAERTASGYRRYGAGDVERLYRIVALRRLGLPLAQIAGVLDGGGLRPVVERHLAHVESELARGERVRRKLRTLLDAEPSSDDLIHLIEETTMHEQYYTEEQLAELAARRDALGEEGMRKAETDWAELIAAVEAERAAGTDPADPKVVALAARWKEMIEAFTGGDPGIRDSMKRMYEQEGPEKASRGAVNPDLLAYIGAAMS
jgi:DNA-binding transcriptional MerR regulator